MSSIPFGTIIWGAAGSILGAAIIFLTASVGQYFENNRKRSALLFETRQANYLSGDISDRVELLSIQVAEIVVAIGWALICIAFALTIYCLGVLAPSEGAQIPLHYATAASAFVCGLGFAFLAKVTLNYRNILQFRTVRLEALIKQMEQSE